MADEQVVETQEAVAPEAPQAEESVLKADAVVDSTPVEPTVLDPVDDAPVEHWLPEDLRGHERLKDFESPEALARAFAEALPAQALPDSYQVPEGFPEQFSKWAKDTKLTQEQLDAVINLNTQVQTNTERTRDNVYSQGRQQLFESWGEGKAENMKTAEAVFKVLPSGPQLAQLLRATGEGANPVVIKALHEIGSFLREGGHISNANVSGKVKTDPLRQRYPTMFKDMED